MEPLSALSVATSVVQFVDFSFSLISGTVERYRSASGTSAESSEIQALTKHLIDMLNTFETNSNSSSPQLQSQHESRLKHLCQACKAPAEELLMVLGFLQAKGKHKLTESLISTFKALGKERKIQKLRAQLNSVQTELILCLQLILE
jgi:tRNA C32,U32 (ribose-2'-O)-methylase TrmJ